MSRFLILIFLMSMSVQAADKLPSSIKVAFPNSSRSIKIQFAKNNISYVVTDNGRSETQKFIDKDLNTLLNTKWDSVVPSLMKARNDYVCVNYIEWTVEMNNKTKKIICKNEELTQKLGDFQKSVQMLMVQ